MQTYYNYNGLTIRLSNQVVNKLNSFYSSEKKYETGGILLGLFNHDFIEITEAYKLKSDILSKFHYRRNTKLAQKLVDKRWTETNGVVNYLGEWHTHPEMSSTPSCVDKITLANVLFRLEDKIPGVVILILGKNKEITMMIGKGKETYALLLS